MSSAAPLPNFVGGRFTDAHSSETFTVVNPATEREIGLIAESDPVDVDAAVRSAHEAFVGSGWADLPPKRRAEYLRALADAFAARASDIANLVTQQNGMPLGMSAYLNGPFAEKAYRYFADVADTLEVEELRVADGVRGLVRRQPVGVSALIVPWNAPHILLAWKIGAALAAGCTTVVKPAPETSLDMRLFADAVLESGIPDGVVNIVTGGRDTGAALVAHPLVSKIGFTGSTAAGKSIAAKAASEMKRVTLELGGKSAAILLDDVDLGTFAPLVIPLCAPNSGQVCVSNTRILAPQHRYDEVVEAVAQAMAAGPVGDPMEPTTAFGPLVADRQRARVEEYVAIGKSEGAEVVLGGGRPSQLERGFYFEPTVFRGVSNSMRIAQEEIFGPVLAVIPYRTDDEAVAIANDSRYGLAGSVFTADPDRGLAIARRIDAGQLRVNTMASANAFPFGGFKESGMGRELGTEGVASYQELKTIYPADQADAARSPLTEHA